MENSVATILGVALGLWSAAGGVFAASPYTPWSNGPSTDPNDFMIGVWYQTVSATTVSGYRSMGVNTFVQPDTSVTQADLDRLTTAGMNIIMPQTALGLTNLSNKTITGWFNTYDEPDNAQPNGSGGYTDPILPANLVTAYNSIKANDSTRPVELNLGAGVAWDNWIGRGTRTNHPEDYAANTTFTWTNGTVYHQGYLAGSDIGAFDIYPMNNTNPQVAGKLNLVGYGVDRLKAWSAPGNPAWNYIETTDINNTDNAPGPTPGQVKAEVWLSLVHGSMGIIYFAHTITPFSEPALLLNPVMNPAVTAINIQVKALAPVLNSDTLLAATITTGTASDVHLDFMTKTLGGNAYLFTVTDQNSNGIALFRDPSLAGVNATVDVLGESRQIAMVDGTFTDTFAASGVHLYEIFGQGSFTPALVSPVPEPVTLGILGLGLLALALRKPHRKPRLGKSG